MAVESPRQESRQQPPIDGKSVIARMKEHPDKNMRTIFGRENYREIQSIGRHVALVLSAENPATLRKAVKAQLTTYFEDPKVRPGLKKPIDATLLSQYDPTDVVYSSSGKVPIETDEAQEVNVGRVRLDELQRLVASPIKADSEEEKESIWRERRRLTAIILTEFHLAAFGQEQDQPTQNFQAKMQALPKLIDKTFDHIAPLPKEEVDIEELLRNAPKKDTLPSPAPASRETAPVINPVAETVFSAEELGVPEGLVPEKRTEGAQRRLHTRLGARAEETEELTDSIATTLKEAGSRSVLEAQPKTNSKRAITLVDMDALLNEDPIEMPEWIEDVMKTKSATNET